MPNYWDQNENETFRDGLVDESEQVQAHELPRSARPQRAAAPQPVDEVIEALEEVADDEDYTDVLSDARLRLEQGRLYELLMNHNLFEGVAADARAIKNVQREIRQYAKERMEIMLGMRQPDPVEKSIPGAFNDVEVSVLKMLAKAASKGKTDAPAPMREGLAPIAAPPKPVQQVIRPMAPAVKAAPPQTPAPKPKQAAPPPAKPLPKAPAKPLPRAKNERVERILAEEGVSRELIEENYKPLEKDPSLMTEEEKLSRNRDIAKRLKKQVQSSSARPMPTYEQQAAQYAADAAQVASQGPMSLLLAAVAKNQK